MPRQVNPGYNFTLKRFFADLPKAIEVAPDHVRTAYYRMRTPPEYELYDLQADPYEFHNLADDATHADIRNELRDRLLDWRRRTNDPLLKPDNLQHLKSEIEACFSGDGPSKDRLILTYPDYFFAPSAAAGKTTDDR